MAAIPPRHHDLRPRFLPQIGMAPDLYQVTVLHVRCAMALHPLFDWRVYFAPAHYRHCIHRRSCPIDALARPLGATVAHTHADFVGRHAWQQVIWPLSVACRWRLNLAIQDLVALVALVAVVVVVVDESVLMGRAVLHP